MNKKLIENKGLFTIEWAPFELVESASEEQLLEASGSLHREFLSSQKGFIRRELLHLQDRKWVDLVYWEDDASAKKAMESAMNSEICYKYFHLMVPADQEAEVGVLHLKQKEIYTKDV
ncbi:MAG: hypothetical protein K8R21_14825 [Leptospira sp.]|nr:hypothetical protein [Leptospira sp.]